MNVLTEKSSQLYLDRMMKWVDIAIEEGVRFFVSSLGNPRWIVERAAKRSSVDSDYWQAGKSVGGIQNIEPVADILNRFAAALPADSDDSARIAGPSATVFAWSRFTIAKSSGKR
jgi:hypothetical protein